LEALAEGVPAVGGLVAPILDARKGQVYAAVYEPVLGSPPRAVLPPFVADPDVALARIEAAISGRPHVCVGDGPAAYSPVLGHLPALPETWSFVRGAVLAAMGRRQALAGSAGRAEALEPVYLRASEAEENIGPPTGEAYFEVR
jgi:tRNA threonylcarbamoyladenosine biosynthesis protein TsaB